MPARPPAAHRDSARLLPAAGKGPELAESSLDPRQTPQKTPPIANTPSLAWPWEPLPQCPPCSDPGNPDLPAQVIQGHAILGLETRGTLLGCASLGKLPHLSGPDSFPGPRLKLGRAESPGLASSLRGVLGRGQGPWGGQPGQRRSTAGGWLWDSGHRLLGHAQCLVTGTCQPVPFGGLGRGQVC